MAAIYVIVHSIKDIEVQQRLATALRLLSPLCLGILVATHAFAAKLRPGNFLHLLEEKETCCSEVEIENGFPQFPQSFFCPIVCLLSVISNLASLSSKAPDALLSHCLLAKSPSLRNF